MITGLNENTKFNKQTLLEFNSEIYEEALKKHQEGSLSLEHFLNFGVEYDVYIKHLNKTFFQRLIQDAVINSSNLQEVENIFKSHDIFNEVFCLLFVSIFEDKELSDKLRLLDHFDRWKKHFNALFTYTTDDSLKNRCEVSPAVFACFQNEPSSLYWMIDKEFLSIQQFCFFLSYFYGPYELERFFSKVSVQKLDELSAEASKELLNMLYNHRNVKNIPSGALDIDIICEPLTKYFLSSNKLEADKPLLQSLYLPHDDFKLVKNKFVFRSLLHNAVFDDFILKYRSMELNIKDSNFVSKCIKNPNAFSEYSILDYYSNFYKDQLDQYVKNDVEKQQNQIDEHQEDLKIFNLINVYKFCKFNHYADQEIQKIIENVRNDSEKQCMINLLLDSEAQLTFDELMLHINKKQKKYSLNI